jgi:aspartokinase
MSITIVGRGISDNPELILELTGAAKEVNVHPLGVSLNSDSAILYLPESQDANPIVEKIHETILKHQETLAMSVRKQLAFLKVRGAGLEDTPGFIGRTTEALRVNSINVFGLLTITSSILLFVGWNDREKALSLIKGALGGV